MGRGLRTLGLKAFRVILMEIASSSARSEEESLRLQADSCSVMQAHEHVGLPQNLQQPKDAGGRSSVGSPQPAHFRGPA